MSDVHAAVTAIEYHLPASVLTTEDLSRRHPQWAVEKIDAKTGIRARHIASPAEFSSDLAASAVHALFASGACAPEEIDFLLLCTQSPDYLIPTTACLLQERLGIPEGTGAFDYNLGCSGYVYGLGVAEGLIATRQARTIILITSETYSKYLEPDDRHTIPIFGDAAAVTLIRARSAEFPIIGPFVYGTNGKGGDDLIVYNSGLRTVEGVCNTIPFGNPKVLRMNGAKVFAFVMSTMPKVIRTLLSRAKLEIGDCDLFVFHQANASLVRELARVLEIPMEKVQITLSHCGNTVSSTIPIALKHAALEGKLTERSRIVIAGFGVGYSWGATVIRGIVLH